MPIAVPPMSPLAPMARVTRVAAPVNFAGKSGDESRTVGGLYEELTSLRSARPRISGQVSQSNRQAVLRLMDQLITAKEVSIQQKGKVAAVILSGPKGSGKRDLFDRLARLTNRPAVIVDAEHPIVGNENSFKDLLEKSMEQAETLGTKRPMFFLGDADQLSPKVLDTLSRIIKTGKLERPYMDSGLAGDLVKVQQRQVRGKDIKTTDMRGVEIFLSTHEAPDSLSSLGDSLALVTAACKLRGGK